MAEIANMGYVVDEAVWADWADGADRADGTDESHVAEMALRRGVRSYAQCGCNVLAKF